ncbi:MAG: ABC transporter permease subunit [Planctomycetota bacterium]
MPTFLRNILTLGPLNPIAVRLVQSASRRGRHNLLRSAYLAVLIITLLWLLLLNAGGASISYRQLAEAGASSFVVIAYLQIALICILAPVFMASAIAQEANPRTWDILLTTPLTPTQIVLGNLLGRLFFIVTLVVAALPLFAITQYFGGVPASAIFASSLIAVAAALLVGASAIALSVSRLVGRRAVFAFYIAVVSVIAATAAGDVLIQQATAAGVTYLTAFNPFLALRALLNPATYPRLEPGTDAPLAFLLTHPVTSWILIATATSTVLVFASALTVRAGGLVGVARAARRARATEDADGAVHRAPRPVGTNPISWREATSRNATPLRILARWSFVAAGALFGIGLIAAYHIGTIDPQQFRTLLLATTWTEAVVISLIAINASATAVSREREDGTLDLLLTTPITPAAYLNGKLKGLIAYLLPLLAVPVGTSTAAGLYIAFDALGNPQGATVTQQVADPSALQPSNAAAQTILAEFPIILPEAGIVTALALIPFVAFCVMTGLKWSLQSKGTIGAVVATVLAVAVVAGTVGLCGWQSGTSLNTLGPVFAGLNPASALFAAFSPYDALRDTAAAGPSGLDTARLALTAGVILSVFFHGSVVWILRASIVRTFDMTVRRLAGTR